MNTEYINGFSCAIKEDGTEIVLAVYKNYPTLDEEGNFNGSALDHVGTLIMTKNVAEELREALDNLLDGKKKDK